MIEKSNKPILINKIIVIIIALISTILFPKLGWIVADNLSLKYNFQQFSIIWDYIHHSIQMIIPLFIMILFKNKISLSQWGFNNDKKQLNKIIIKKFCLGYFIFFSILKLIYILIINPNNILDFSPQLKSIQSVLFFRFFFVGISEEILFRSFIFTILLTQIKKTFIINNIEIPYASIIASVFFALAHISFSIFPFNIIYINPLQIFFCFIFAMFYTIIFYKTKSIIAPIIIHNFIDGYGTLFDYLITLTNII